MLLVSVVVMQRVNIVFLPLAAHDCAIVTNVRQCATTLKVRCNNSCKVQKEQF
jgi:hypothetical protein